MSVLLIVAKQWQQPNRTLADCTAAVEILKDEFHGEFRGAPSPLGFGLVYEADDEVEPYLETLGACLLI